jgi:MFS family permease
MSVIRFVVGPLSLRIAPALLLAGAFLVAIGGWTILWTATTPALAMVGLVVSGLGYGAQYPLSVALLLATAPHRPDAIQGRATLAAGLAVGLAPFALGALADQFGTHRAFLLVPVVALVGGAAALAGGRAVRRTVVAEVDLVALGG